jgi:hypothetical protein
MRVCAKALIVMALLVVGGALGSREGEGDALLGGILAVAGAALMAGWFRERRREERRED